MRLIVWFILHLGSALAIFLFISKLKKYRRKLTFNFLGLITKLSRIYFFPFCLILFWWFRLHVIVYLQILNSSFCLNGYLLCGLLRSINLYFDLVKYKFAGNISFCVNCFEFENLMSFSLISAPLEQLLPRSNTLLIWCRALAQMVSTILQLRLFHWRYLNIRHQNQTMLTILLAIYYR